jgi:hypothetical protein
VEVGHCEDRTLTSSATYYIAGEIIPFEKRPGLFGLFGVVSLRPDSG